MMNGAVSAGSAGRIIKFDLRFILTVEQAGAIYNGVLHYEKLVHQHFQRKLPVKNSTGARPFRAQMCKRRKDNLLQRLIAINRKFSVCICIRNVARQLWL
jgi:hypothetical protein